MDSLNKQESDRIEQVQKSKFDIILDNFNSNEYPVDLNSLFVGDDRLINMREQFIYPT